jgi:hypothetical protein
MVVRGFRFLLIGLVCITSLASTYLTFKRQSFDLYEEKTPNTCEMDANCNRFHSCIDGTCHPYYNREIDNIIFFKGVNSEHCLVGYKQTGPRFSYENETYPGRFSYENIKQREIFQNWILGLCIFTKNRNPFFVR